MHLNLSKTKVIAIKISVLVISILLASLITSKFLHHLRWKNLSDSYIKINADGSLFLNGKLTASLLVEFKQLTAGKNLTGKRLIVRSQGGDMIVGIELGNIIFQNKMDIEVDGICMSACANYLFTSANYKYISENSGVIFHGGATQRSFKEKFNNPELRRDDNIEASVTTLTDYDKQILTKEVSGFSSQNSAYEYLLNKETQFFNKIGVNQLITIYGQLGQYEYKYISKEFTGFIYDISDLSKFGVNNVIVKDGKRWRGYKNNYARNTYWAKVTDLPVVADH